MTLLRWVPVLLVSACLFDADSWRERNDALQTPGAGGTDPGTDDTDDPITYGTPDCTELVAYYRDDDDDGLGDPESAIGGFCDAPAGFVTNNDDCDDNNAAIGQLTFYGDSDGDGFGDETSTTAACLAPAGFVENAEDCDDGDGTVYPRAEDIARDGIDQDCDEADALCGVVAVSAEADLQDELALACPGDTLLLAADATYDTGPYVLPADVVLASIDPAAPATLQGTAPPLLTVVSGEVRDLVIDFTGAVLSDGEIDGGCMLLRGSDGVVVEGVELRYCRADNGGGMYIGNQATDVHLIDVSILGDSTTGVNGGAGIFIRNVGVDVTLDGITIDGGVAQELGGGLAIENQGNPLVIDRLTINGTSASSGGGVSVIDSDGVQLNGVTLRGTGALGEGAGVYVSNSTVDFTDLAVTDVASFYGFGGGLMVGFGSAVTVTGGVIDNVSAAGGAAAGVVGGSLALTDVEVTRPGGFGSVFEVADATLTMLRVSSVAGPSVFRQILAFGPPPYAYSPYGPTVVSLENVLLFSETPDAIEMLEGTVLIDHSTIIGPMPFNLQNPGTYEVAHTMFYDGQQTPPPVDVFGATFDCDYCLFSSFYPVDVAGPGSVSLTNSVTYSSGLPLFTNAVNLDFTLAVGSQAIDVGDSACIDPDGTRCDLGYTGGPNAL